MATASTLPRSLRLRPVSGPGTSSVSSNQAAARLTAPENAVRWPSSPRLRLRRSPSPNRLQPRIATNTIVPVAKVAHGLKICHEFANIWPSSGIPEMARCWKSSTSTQKAPPR